MLKKWMLSLFVALAFSMSLAFAADKINLNTATQDELQALNGVGPATAAAIIEYRNTNGKFSSVDELTNVKGVGEKKLSKLAEQLTISEE